MLIAFRLKPGKDDDLIAWLKSIQDGDRSNQIKMVLRGENQLPVKSENLFPDVVNRLESFTD